jgi:DNA invertase Pin-like site-specific DNA recombinase
MSACKSSTRILANRAGDVDRHGFQKLIAEIGLGNADLVVSVDASRLGRARRGSAHELQSHLDTLFILTRDLALTQQDESRASLPASSSRPSS